MPSYHLLFLHGGKLIGSERIEADHALDAAEQAAKLAGRHHAELWAASGGRIATFRARDACGRSERSIRAAA